MAEGMVITSHSVIKRLWLPLGVHTLYLSYSLSLPCTSHSGKSKLSSCEQPSGEDHVVRY